MRHRWLPAAAVALAAMTLVLLASWWNRSGGRRDIVLTERETELVQGQDGRGIVLVFNEPPAEAGNRITVAKLAALGADTTGSTMSVALGGGLHGYAVFELGGLVWRRNAELAIREYVAAVVAPDTVPERQDSLLNDFRRTQEERVTRLVLADAGIDAEALAREYDDPAKYLILPADLAIQRRFRAGPGFEGDMPGEPAPALRIHGLRMPISGAALRALRTTVGVPVRYRVTVSTGRRFEPWVTALQVLEARAPDSVRVH